MRGPKVATHRDDCDIPIAQPAGASWTQQSYLEASNTGDGDLFGSAVALFGGAVAVGAERESSDSTGIDGDQLNDSAFQSGAAYVFEGAGTSPDTGMPYCMANANSTGTAGELTGCGSTSVANNNLTLVATNLPVGAFGFFLTSTVQGGTVNAGGSDGNLCLGGGDWALRWTRPDHGR